MLLVFWYLLCAFPSSYLAVREVEEKRGRNLCFLSKLIGSNSQILVSDSSMAQDLLNPLSSSEDQVEAGSPQVHTFSEHDFSFTYL